MSTAYQLLEWSCCGRDGRVMTVFFDLLDGTATQPRWKPPTSDWSHVDHGVFATFDDALEAVKDSLIGHGIDVSSLVERARAI